MASYHWHLIGALFVFFLFFIAFKAFGTELTPAVLVFSLLVCLFAGLFPDIDSRRSKIHRILTDFLVIVVAVLIISYTFETWMNMLWLLLFWFLLSGPLFHVSLKHRGFIHSIWLATIFGFVIGFIALISLQSFVPGLFAFVGYFSHLAIDRKV